MQLSLQWWWPLSILTSSENTLEKKDNNKQQHLALSLCERVVTLLGTCAELTAGKHVNWAQQKKKFI